MRVKGAKRNPKLVDNTVTVNVNGKKFKIHNVFVIDASGSMDEQGKYGIAISGVNEILKSIKQDVDTENTITIVEFEGHRIEKRIDMSSSIPDSYRGMGTGGMTPLNQAVGETLEYIVDQRKRNWDEGDKVLVNVFTDGGENSSQGTYRNSSVLGNYIKALVDLGVTVTFVGTKQEVAYAQNSLHVLASNTLVHDNTAASVKKSFLRTASSRQAYSKSVSRGESVVANFYSKTVAEDEDQEPTKK